MEKTSNPLKIILCHFGFHNHDGRLNDEEQQGLMRMVKEDDCDALVAFFMCASMYCTSCGKLTETSKLHLMQEVNRKLAKMDDNND